jgi:hypothetical protein
MPNLLGDLISDANVHQSVRHNVKINLLMKDNPSNAGPVGEPILREALLDKTVHLLQLIAIAFVSNSAAYHLCQFYGT